MGVWPLLLVALFAGIVGLLELDWAQFLADPAREALRELWAEVGGWRDLEARVRIWGMGAEPVRMRIQAIPEEGALRLELLGPEALAGEIYTYRRGMLVHYRPDGGGVRIVHVLGDEVRLPGFELRPGDLEATLEGPEPIGAGLEVGSPPLGLPGIAGTAAPGPWPSLPPAPDLLRLKVTGLPEPVDEVVVWLDGRKRIRGGTVVLGSIRVTVLVEEVRHNLGLDLLGLLRLPRAETTLWYGEDQSM